MFRTNFHKTFRQLRFGITSMCKYPKLQKFVFTFFPSFLQIPDSPEEDYSLTLSRTSRLSSNTHEQYHGVMDLLRKQHKVRVFSKYMSSQTVLAEMFKL